MFWLIYSFSMLSAEISNVYYLGDLFIVIQNFWTYLYAFSGSKVSQIPHANSRSTITKESGKYLS
jgi:hypothetical protein